MHPGLGALQSCYWFNALFTVNKVTAICSQIKRDGKAFWLNEANADKLR